jgi:hypothetical protein
LYINIELHMYVIFSDHLSNTSHAENGENGNSLQPREVHYTLK